MPKPFIDIEDTTSDELPPPPVTDEVIAVGPPKDIGEHQQHRYGHLLPHGTTVSPQWDDDWMRLVIDAEKRQGYAICGAKRRSEDLQTNEDLQDPLMRVCKKRGGTGTDHPGEGRCSLHGGSSHLGTMTTGKFSLIRNHKLSGRVHDFFDQEELLDLRSTIGTTWAAMDAMLDEDDEISPERAQQIGAMMTRVANMIKQHNDIQEKKRISIDVPEFMAWADFFYELAVKHLEEAGGDVPAFLRDAQSFYDRTVTIVVGPTAGRNSLGAGGQVGAESDAGVSRPVIEVT